MTKIEFTQDIDLDMGHGTTAMIKSGERFMVTITAENQGFCNLSFGETTAYGVSTRTFRKVDTE